MSDYFSSKWTYRSEVGPDWDEASKKMFECMNSAFRKSEATKYAQEALKIALARVGEGHRAYPLSSWREDHRHLRQGG